MNLPYLPILTGYTVLYSLIVQCNKRKNINKNKLVPVKACQTYERMEVEIHSLFTRHALELGGQLYVPSAFYGSLCKPQRKPGYFDEEAKSLAFSED